MFENLFKEGFVDDSVEDDEGDDGGGDDDLKRIGFRVEW